MELLIKHNLISGWRNILKYKTQNFISVLCLSVGTLFFAIVIWFISGVSNTQMWKSDANTYSIILQNNSLYDSDNKIPEIINDIRNSSDIKDIYYELSSEGFIRDEKHYYNLTIISPNWCKFRNITSALTGKKMQTLKNGTLLLTDRRQIINCSNDTNITNFEMHSFYESYGIKSKQRVKINDIISTSLQFDRFTDFLLVDDFSKPSILKASYIRELDVITNKKINITQLRDKINNLIKRYNYEVSDVTETTDENIIGVKTLLCILIFLGSSVLVIGISGYLKMQIQLFHLRSKEMALRKCNGAKPINLFGLLGAELLIIFFFVAILSIMLSLTVEAYIIPFLYRFQISYFFNINIKDIFKIELIIIFLTYLISLIIACISIRKIISVPLGKTAGRSYSPQTIGDKILQVVQYFVTTILLFFIILAFLSLNSRIKEVQTSNPPQYYKQVAQYDNYIIPNDLNIARTTFYTNYEQVSLLSPTFAEINRNPHLLPSAKLIGCSMNLNWNIDYQINSDIVPSKKRKENEDGTISYNYDIRVTTPKLFTIMKEKIYASNKDDDQLIPIYVPKNESEQIAEELRIEHPINSHIYKLPSGFEYKRIGYAHQMDDVKKINPPYDLYIVHTDLGWEHHEIPKDSLSSFDERLFILPKEGKFSKLNDELNALLHVWNSHLSVEFQYSVSSIYDNQFQLFALIEIISHLCWVLVFISTISIILTVYSSVSLETRGRQKEIAIRKVNGAKTFDIVKMFCHSHVIVLIIAFSVVPIIILGIIFFVLIQSASWALLQETFWKYFIAVYFLSIFIITFVTFCTIGQKIYKVAHINPADMIRKE